MDWGIGLLATGFCLLGVASMYGCWFLLEWLDKR
jgi:hypothetical protein